jgi:hypothetical protein
MGKVMANPQGLTSSSSGILDRLDSLFATNSSRENSSYAESSSSAFKSAEASENAAAKSISANTSDKGYRKLTALGNVTSYSKNENLHACPRLFELEMFKAAKAYASSEIVVRPNYDFAFGHAVGAGIQTLAATNSLAAGQFAAFLAWKLPYEGEKLDKNDKPTGKSLPMALWAVEKFHSFWTQDLADWEVLILPNGKPAVELAFGVDTQNGYYHFGHIDIILRHLPTNRLAVWEGKTTGLENIQEAAYANSYQALGYSVVVDAIANSLGLDAPDYEVLYICYSSKSREFQLLPFTKNRTQRAEWLQDLLLNHAMITKYTELGFFPKRGSNCINTWGRTCEWFGNCHMKNSSLFPGVTIGKLETIDGLESLDFSFKLFDLVTAQTTLRG